MRRHAIVYGVGMEGRQYYHYKDMNEYRQRSQE